MPNLIGSVRFFDLTATEMQNMLISTIENESADGLRELDQLEANFAASNRIRKFTKRSRYQIANKFMLAFPSLTQRRLGSVLGTTPQGAGYLCRQLQNAAVEQRN